MDWMRQRVGTMRKDLVVAFLNAAMEIGACDRGMAVDDEMNILDSINLNDETRQSPRFNLLMSVAVRRSLDTNEAIITNNVVTSAAEAPLTNTSFSDLRMVVAIPLEGIGAIYMDKPVKQGIIPRQMVDTLYEVGQDVIKSDPPIEADKDEFITRYKQR
jgi:hypothetical protein